MYIIITDHFAIGFAEIKILHMQYIFLTILIPEKPFLSLLLQVLWGKAVQQIKKSSYTQPSEYWDFRCIFLKWKSPLKLFAIVLIVWKLVGSIICVLHLTKHFMCNSHHYFGISPHHASASRCMSLFSLLCVLATSDALSPLKSIIEQIITFNWIFSLSAIPSFHQPQWPLFDYI